MPSGLGRNDEAHVQGVILVPWQTDPFVFDSLLFQAVVEYCIEGDFTIYSHISIAARDWYPPQKLGRLGKIKQLKISCSFTGSHFLGIRLRTPSTSNLRSGFQAGRLHQTERTDHSYVVV